MEGVRGTVRIMKRAFCVVITAALAAAGCSKKDKEAAPAETNTTAATGNPITAPVDYLGAVAQAKKHAESTIELVSINQAIQLFVTEEGRAPASLNELVTKKYLPHLPAPPYGKQLSYDPRTGSVKLIPK